MTSAKPFLVTMNQVYPMTAMTAVMAVQIAQDIQVKDSPQRSTCRKLSTIVARGFSQKMNLKEKT